MSIELERYDWPLVCLTHDTVNNLWYPTLYVKHPHMDAWRYRLMFINGFETRGCAESYALKEFLPNVDRHANHEVQLKLDCVFEWDGDGSPDPGPWMFDLCK